jgi:hypothetical protein
MAKKVLAIGMYDSVHFARWLAQFQDQNIDFLLFPSSPHRRLHAKLQELLSGKGQATYSLAPLSRFYGLPFWLADKFFGNRIRGFMLKRLAFRISPDYIHALELQNAGYIVLRSFRKRKPKNSKLAITNYGSDIYWFQRFHKHLEKIKQLLAIADMYACECERDVKIAKDLGFQGEIMPVRPNAGGFGDAILSAKLKEASQRKTIAIKGYHGWVGRAHTAIEAIRKISNLLGDYDIVFYSCNQSTIRLAKKCAKETGLRIFTHAKGKLAHNQMLELFADSAVYVGLSESDGISTSLLEAMALGAIPVQTATACCDEWFSEKSGVAVSSIVPETVANAIERALNLAKDGRAANLNRETVREKASEDFVKQAALTFYR